MGRATAPASGRQMSLFYSDRTQIIRENYGREPATAQSEALR